MSDEELLIENAKRTADAIVGMLGKRCEVAVHDFSDLDHSLVYLAGSVTSRQVGAPITDLVLHVLGQAEAGTSSPEDLINYRTLSKAGSEMKSSTVFLRDSDDNVVGALCINLRIGDLRVLSEALEDLISFDPTPDSENESFPSTVQEMASEVVSRTVSELGVDPSRMATEDKIECVSLLESRGFFLIKGAVDYVADILGVSKYTIYSYLQKVRSDSVFEPGGVDK